MNAQSARLLASWFGEGGMAWRRALTRALDAIILLLLMITIGALIYGHQAGTDSGLSLTDSYISEYMKMAPHWPWLIVSSFSLALLLSVLSLAFLLRAKRSPWIVLGCLLLAMTAMANFFVAYAPVRRVQQPPSTNYEWWTPTWWFTSTTSSTPYQDGMADAYSDVHYRATRLAVATGVIAVLLLGFGLVRFPPARSFGWCSLAVGIAMSVLFLMGDHMTYHHGLWQRTGVLIFYTWLYFAWHQCRNLGLVTYADQRFRRASNRRFAASLARR